MSGKHTIHMIGNAHIDPVWLWQWQQGYAEIKATFRSALDRMKEFPDFIFTCACAAYYQWVEENCPEMFEEVKTRIKEGRWVIVGGWWIQPDCNIPSGESFVRHGLYSQRYFKEKFGVTAVVGYNVDSFGHNGMLPQILKKSGMDYYVFMRPMDNEKNLPGNLFWWESMDGSRVMTFKIHFAYNNYWYEGSDFLREKALAVAELADKQRLDMMDFYGVGNHGGGPTIANIHSIHKLQAEEPEGRHVFSSPNRYFNEVSRKQPVLPVVKEELQHHARGCYSAYSTLKRTNRRAESRLISAEKFVSAAHQLLRFPYPKAELGKAWKRVMFNQFHDIMGGCSIKEAYEDAGEFYGEALSIGADVLNGAVQKLSWAVNTMGGTPVSLSKDKDMFLWEMQERGVPCIVFNPLSWETLVPVQVTRCVRGIADEDGNPLVIQRVRASRTNGEDKWDTLFMAGIPAMGYRVYRLFPDKSFELEETEKVTASTEGILENTYILAEIDKHTGFIKRMFDKVNQVEVFSGSGAVPVVLDEIDSDTWAHNIKEFRNEVARFSDAEIQVLENGPIRARIRAVSSYNTSRLQQEFILYNDRKQLEVRVKLDWREKHKMLKLSFPINIDQPKAVYEIPYGFIERSVNGEEEPGQQWLDVSGCLSSNPDGVYGLALLNDCKYSFDVKENDLRMTVARSPVFADHFGQRDEFCEYMDQGNQEFRYILLPHNGEWKDAGVVRRAYELNAASVSINETYHEGPLPLKFEGIRIDAVNVIASVFKQAEDENGYILRCYEAHGCDAEAELEIPFLHRRWKAKFNPCEIMTFYIPKEQAGEIMETDLIEMQEG